jgi:hypothetical protein
MRYRILRGASIVVAVALSVAATAAVSGCAATPTSKVAVRTYASCPAHGAYSAVDADTAPSIVIEDAVATAGFEFELPEDSAVGAPVSKVVPQDSAFGTTFFVYYANGVEVAIQPTDLAMDTATEATSKAERIVGSGRPEAIYSKIRVGAWSALAHEPFEQSLGGPDGPKNNVPAVITWQASSANGPRFLNYTVYGAEGMRMSDVVRIAKTMRPQR